MCGHEGALNAPGYVDGPNDWPPRGSPNAALPKAPPLPLWIWLLALGILASASVGLLSALL